MEDFRCFGTGKPLYEKYHDEEWGVIVHDDQYLFEMLCLEGAQAGLSWETILKKREDYRRLFHRFQIDLVAKMSDQELEKVLKDPSIVRNRRKIFSVRNNAKVLLILQKEFGSFDEYLWGFIKGRQIINHFAEQKDVPSRSDISDQIAKDLKKRGFSFIGTKIIYAFMQAIGMVNDHLISCPSKNSS